MNLTRRFFLQSSGALAAYLGVQPLLAETVTASDAAGSTDLAQVRKGKTLVVVFLRGGLDGLNFIVPYADPHYADLRPDLRVRRPGEDEGALDLDGRFGLNPRAAALLPFFRDGSAVAAHAVGYPNASRSHFEEQDVWETGVVGNTLGADGWLNRHLQTSTGDGPLRAIAIGDALPRILRGDAPALAFRGLDQLDAPRNERQAKRQDRIAAALEHAFADSPIAAMQAAGESAFDAHAHPDAVAEQMSRVAEAAARRPEQRAHARELLAQAGQSTLKSLDLLRDIAANPHPTPTKWPETGLARRFQTAAQLIHADIDVEVLEIDYGGWDTHDRQGNGAQGNYGNKIAELADALAAFASDLGPRLDDTLVLTLSDFGRTAAQNGSAGTDHGWANCMLAMGGPVAEAGQGKRRKVAGRWPGLGPEQLHQGRDLLHTTDFRDVMAEAVSVHLGNPHLTTILPDYAPSPVGLIAG